MLLASSSWPEDLFDQGKTHFAFLQAAESVTLQETFFSKRCSFVQSLTNGAAFSQQCALALPLHTFSVELREILLDDDQNMGWAHTLRVIACLPYAREAVTGYHPTRDFPARQVVG